MKIFSLVLCLLVLIPGVIRADKYDVKEKERIERSVSFGKSAKGQVLTVDNIWGSITVVGSSGNRVDLKAEKEIAAVSRAKIEQAKQDVKLAVSEKNGHIRMIVDGPFRKEDGSIKWDKEPGYRVSYDFELKVPQNTRLILKTITGGDILVRDCGDGFVIKNVNGKIRVEGLSGAGEVVTVNGGIYVSFNQNPNLDCQFKTVNGNIDVHFLSDLSADFQLKTFHGDMYSDFPATYLPQKAVPGKRTKGKYVYKGNQYQRVRIGKGGPSIKMDTLNGDIHIAKK